MIFSMVTFSGKLRQSLLEDHFVLDQWPVDPQMGPILIFLVLFVLGLACLGWISWVLWKGFAEPGEGSV